MRYEIEFLQVEDADWPSDRVLSNKVMRLGEDFVEACQKAQEMIEDIEITPAADYVIAQVVGYHDDEDDGEIMFSCRKGR